MSLGNRIREARNQKNLTQEQLAAIIGVSKNAVSNYENGVSFPKSIDIFIGIIDTLGVDANYLLQDEMAQTHKNTPAADSDEGDKQKEKLIKNYHKLNTDGQGKLVDYSDDLAEMPKYTAEEPEQKYRTIKYFDQPAAAGYSEWINTDSYVDYDIPDIPEYASVDFAVKVDGDSMLPDYENGDIVLVHSQNTTLDGDVGIWWVEGEGTLIKELRKGSLYPHNKDYSPITLRGKDHRCYGRVVAKLKK